MIAIKELMSVEVTAAEAKAKLEAEAQQLAAEAAKQQAAMDEAIARGDMADYSRHETKRRAVVARLAHVRSKIANPDPCYTKEDVLSAWADYCADYNASIAPLIADYGHIPADNVADYSGVVNDGSDSDIDKQLTTDERILRSQMGF